VVRRSRQLTAPLWLERARPISNRGRRGRAERLRRHGGEIVFVTGAELSLMGRGFLPGDTLNERVELLTTQPQRLPELVADASARVNDFLATATALVRGRFEGKITYGENPKPP
jgi:hypothetical protein